MDCVVKVKKSRSTLQNNVTRKSNDFIILGRMVIRSVLTAIAAPCFILSIKCNAALSERRDAKIIYCFRFQRLSLLLLFELGGRAYFLLSERQVSTVPFAF